MKRGKRGQIALYVIIAIVIVGVIAVLFAFRSQIFKPSFTAEEAQKLVSAQVQPVRDTVEGCMRTMAMKTLNTMGRGGGYAYPKAERVSVPTSVMPDALAISYALYKDSTGYQNYLPSLNEMKSEFVDFVGKNPDWSSCINNFANFKLILDVSNGSLAMNSSALDFGEKSGQIVIIFTYPVTIAKQNATSLIDNYIVRIPVNLYLIHDTAASITNNIASGGNFVVLLQDLAKQQEANLRINPEAETILVRSSSYTEELSLSPPVYAARTLFKVQYNNKALETPFDFYLLAGED